MLTTRHRHAIAALTVAGVFAGLAIPWSSAGAQPSSPPVAEAPVFKVGDQWRWTRGGQRRIVGIDGQYTVTPYSSAACKNCRAYRDRNLTIVKLVDSEGNIVVDDSQVGYKMLDFPLSMGKRWESNVSLVNRTTRVVEPYKNTFSVEAYEDVTTRAGTFKAFRITHIQQPAHSSFSQAAGREWRESLWYSPAAKAFVKREVNTKADWGPDWELESYSLK